MKFVGFEQGFKNCFNNAPLGSILNAPQRAIDMFNAFTDGDFDKVSDMMVQNAKNSSLFYNAGILGALDNFFD